MKNKTKKTRSEHGNVLFLILIAVALFAALSYVVTQSSRSGSGNIGKEDAKLAAAEILNYVTSVQTAVQTLMLRRECGINKITFDNPFDNNAHVNPNAPATFECHVFRPEGGAVPYKTAKPEWMANPDPSLLYFYFTGSEAITNVGTTCAGPSCAELSMNIWGLQKSLCEALNVMMGEPQINTSIPSTALMGCPFDGAFDCGGTPTAIAFAAPTLRGKLSACYNDTTYGYTFNTVLVAR